MVYYWFNNPFTDEFGSQSMNLPPITFYDRPRPHKITHYTPDLLPAAISVASENYVSTFTTPSDSPDFLTFDNPYTLYVLKKDVNFIDRMKRGYCCRKYDQKWCYKKTRFYSSTRYDNTKNFYYCHGFSRINSATRTCFL